MQRVELKTLSVAFLVGLAHLLAGIAVVVEPAALLVAPFASLRDVEIALGFDAPVAGAVMMVAGAMAMAGVSNSFYGSRALACVLLAPQQILLLLQLWSISVSLGRGQYPDGYIPVGGGWFLLTDQVFAFVLAVSHTVWLAIHLWGRRDGRL